MYTRQIPTSKSTIVFLSSYPPRECGIATFTQDLLRSSQKFLESHVDCKVAALNVSPLETYKYPPEVEWKIDQNNDMDYRNLANIFTNDTNITGIIVQHEYGIFGGIEGEKLLSFMKDCKKPILVTLHTVLPNPSPEMRTVTAAIIQYASTIVVLTNSSKKIIESLYSESIGKTFMIPHGIHPVTFSSSQKYKEILQLDKHIIVSTFGLLSRGKGIEYVLLALPDVIKKYPSLLYLILGETHPVIRRREGEEYRSALATLITKLKIENNVKFYDQYFSLTDLFQFLKATDIYIATSTDENQAVSGTFSYALGTGRAVISTEFAQSKEIVTPETGRLIPIKDPPALTTALLDLLSDEKRLMRMHRNAYKETRSMVWDTIAEKYLALLGRMVIPSLKIDHLVAMTDNFGLFQFALHTVPNKEFGYTLDDNARALIVCSWLTRRRDSKELDELVKLYLTFIKKCQLKDGSFVNYIGFNDKRPTLQNNKEDLEESQTRAVWALSEVIANVELSDDIRIQAKSMFLLHVKQRKVVTHLRAKAFTIKSFALVLDFLPEIHDFLLSRITEDANSLLGALSENSVKSWRWFESYLNYNNALLSESLLIAGTVTQNDTYITNGLLSLKFLISKTFSKTYMPIGHAQWYKNKQKRSNYDQQPEDPASMILALVRAFNLTGEKQYKQLANTCFSWFLGNNSLKTPLYDYKNGGCYDGLHPDRVNLNQGAESLVSYLMASVIIMNIN